MGDQNAKDACPTREQLHKVAIFNFKNRFLFFLVQKYFLMLRLLGYELSYNYYFLSDPNCLPYGTK